MEIWPAIDLRGGRCVRLLQGDYARETVFGDDPVAMAQRFVAAGARRLHIVDLDGAKDGGPSQSGLVMRMTREAGRPVQVGGGIRARETVGAYLAAGVERVVLGSVAIEDPALLERLAVDHPGRIVLGLDARDGKVAVRGWLDTSTLSALDVARRHASLPLAAVVYTDIATDGMLGGPNLTAIEHLVDACRLPVVASGGVATVEDIRRLRGLGCTGCIVGRALYDGAFTIAEALEAGGDP